MSADWQPTALPAEEFEAIDRELAALLERLLGGPHPAVALAAALTSRSVREGSSCLALDAFAARRFGELECPAADAWRRDLLAAEAVTGRPGALRPLILDATNRLYLHRLWHDEATVADTVRELAAPAVETGDSTRLGEALRRLFPGSAQDGPDWQQVAAFAAARSGFCLISGGPGTGKTRTVVYVLALLQELAGGRALRFAIAAPTGKAAARLQESIRRARASLPCADEVRARIPDEVRTIHRLLGGRPDGSFRHGAGHPLALDVLVVDEASMVDLSLMARLLAAVPAGARVILLGDKDQLPSVEAGSVLASLAPPKVVNRFPPGFAREFEQATGQSLPAEALEQAGTPAPRPEQAHPLLGRVVHLRRNYRFADDSAIHRASQAVNRGAVGEALALLTGETAHDGSVKLAHLPPPGALKAALRDAVLPELRAVHAAASPADALAALGRLRILCAVREGPYGVEQVNRLVAELLREAGLAGGGEWFRGRQVMVTANDYGLKLFNGDVGVAWPAEGGSIGEPEVHFAGDDGRPRGFAPARLPPHEAAFALTVHKSQGSEFDRVLLILPAPAGCDARSEAAFWSGPGRLLTRELLYTGLTRARRHVTLWAEPATLSRAIREPVRRDSGLGDRFIEMAKVQ